MNDLSAKWKISRKMLKLRLVLTRNYNNNFQHIIENLDIAINNQSKPLNSLFFIYSMSKLLNFI